DDVDVFTIGNQFYKLNERTLEKLNIAEDCQYFFKSDSHQLALQSVGNEIFAFNSFKVKTLGIEATSSPRPQRGTSFSMPFMKKLSVEGNTVSCSRSINVPGRPALINENFMVTNESVGRSFYPYHIA